MAASSRIWLIRLSVRRLPAAACSLVYTSQEGREVARLRGRSMTDMVADLAREGSAGKRKQKQPLRCQ